MTLTVVLCAHNEERYLEEQLDAILRQSRLPDELVLLDDGSTDRTRRILAGVRHRRMTLLANARPSGPNAAYNQAARLATSDWIYLAGAHDIVQPGAFEAFAGCIALAPRDVSVGRVSRPVLFSRNNSDGPGDPSYRAVLICGDQVDVACGWLPRAGYLTPEQLRLRWQGPEMHWINGNATFIRRDAWRGEWPRLAWLGDWWQYHTLALRRGLVYLPYPITQWRPLPTSHSLGYTDPQRMKPVALELARLLNAPEHADIRAAFLNTGLLDIPHAGGGMVRHMVGLPDVDPVPEDCFADGNGR
jgi:glycosyltransferase involved in cell wall biosynthesis